MIALRRIFLLLALFASPWTARAQIVAAPGVVGGVAIAPDGFLQMRQVAPALSPADPQKADLLYVSLPRVLDEWKSAKDTGKDLPADVRFLHGLTQIQNVFVFPDDHDIVLAGPGEKIRADNSLEPVGAHSGRPLVQLEDLIVALRAVAGRGGSGDGFFGCSLDPPANFEQAWQPTLDRFGRGPRAQLQAEMKKALGPQRVRLLGVPDDARLALAMIAADYRLKRICMGLEMVPPGLGNALGTQAAAPRFWFEPAYEPLLESADGNSYEFCGPRLKVLAGLNLFHEGGVADAQKKFAENLTTKIQEVAARIDAIADLQNIVDCFFVAALIREDKLLDRAHVDLTWLFDAAASPYKTAVLPVPRTADTVVHIAGNVIAQGGVAIRFNSLVAVNRAPAEKPMTAASDRPATGWFLAKQK